jgi:hypothetical protein
MKDINIGEADCGLVSVLRYGTQDLVHSHDTGEWSGERSKNLDPLFLNT